MLVAPRRLRILIGLFMELLDLVLPVRQYKVLYTSPGSFGRVLTAKTWLPFGAPVSIRILAKGYQEVMYLSDFIDENGNIIKDRNLLIAWNRFLRKELVFLAQKRIAEVGFD